MPKISGGKWTVIRLDEMRQQFGGVCNFDGCKETEKLEFAHRHGFATGVNGMGRGSHIRLKDITKNPMCYILLCYTHHHIYDSDQDDEE